MRSVSIFGSTGSIGKNTVSLLTPDHTVCALSASSNVELLAQQAKELGAEVAVIANEANYRELKDRLAGSGVEAAAGANAISEAAQRPVDWGMSAIVGSAGLPATLELAKHAGVLALANKESMVCAGALVKDTIARSGCMLIPVDSEHSAIYQSLKSGKTSEISRIILTGSGGPFRTWTVAQMQSATLEQALKHPNFDMGQRITIDSATMFNKALEMVEAQQLFEVPAQNIEALIHPQQIIHSLVEFQDNTMIAQLGVPDMRGAIGYALHYPERLPLPVDPLDLTDIGRFDFEAPDKSKFPAIELAEQVMQSGGLSGAIFNGAKECALDRFIAGEIGFLDMAKVIAYVLNKLSSDSTLSKNVHDIEHIIELDKQSKRTAKEWRLS